MSKDNNPSQTPNSEFTFHVQNGSERNPPSHRGDSEEKRAPAAEQSYADAQFKEQIKGIINTNRKEGKSNEKILEILLDNFSNSGILLTLLESLPSRAQPSERNEYLSQSFDKIINNNITSAAYGTSKADIEEKGSYDKAGESPSPLQEEDKVARAIDTYKNQGHNDNKTLEFIMKEFKGHPTVDSILAFSEFMPLKDVFLQLTAQLKSTAPAGQWVSATIREVEKTVATVEQSLAKLQGPDPAVLLIKARRAQGVKDEEILNELIQDYSISDTVEEILELREYIKLNILFDGYINNLQDSSSNVVGPSKSDKEEKAAPALEQNPAQPELEASVIKQIKLMKTQNISGEIILNRIKETFPPTATYEPIKFLAEDYGKDKAIIMFLGEDLVEYDYNLD